MSLFTRTRRRTSSSSSHGKPSRRTLAPLHQRRLRLEPLEDRRLLSVFYQTGFDSGLPSEWSVVDNDGAGQTWTSTNPRGRIDPNWNGTFMIADSDYAGLGETMNEELISQHIDCSAHSNVSLRFSHSFQRWQSEICDVDVRVNGGDWQNVQRYQNASASGTATIDIHSIADGQSDVQVRWHYYNANWAYWWGIDNVALLESTGDMTPPTVTNYVPANNAIFDSSSVNIDVTFSEAVQNVHAADMTLGGVAAASATVGAPTNTGGTTWRFPVSGLVPGGLHVNLGGDITDMADNPLTPAAWHYTVDGPPTVRFWSPATGSTVAARSLNIDVTFSKTVLNVDAADMTLSGDAAASATLGTVTNTAGNTWRFPVSGLVNGTLSVSLGGNITDSALRPLTPLPTTWTYTIVTPVVKTGHVGLGCSEVAVSADGNYAYVLTPESFDVLDLSGPAPARIGSLSGIQNSSGDIELAGSLAYVTDPSRGLVVVNVSNPAAPTQAGFYAMPNAREVEVVGTRAYVAGGNILTVLNVSDPASIQPLGTPYTALTGVYGLDVVDDVAGQTAYVADGESGLRILDVTTPAAIVLRATYDTPGMAESVQVASDVVYGKVAYVADYDSHYLGQSGLLMINVATAGSPTLLGRAAGNYGQEVAVAGSTAYLGDGNDVNIFDVSNPAAPELRKSCYIPNWSQGLVLAPGRMFVTYGDALDVWDVTTPSLAWRASSYFVPPSSAQDVDVAGNFTYVADGSQGLRIIDTSNPAAPQVIGTYPCYAYNVQVVGDLAYVSDGWSLTIVSVAAPSSPTLKGYCSISVGNGGMDVVGSRVYLVGYNGFTIVDVSNPESPAVLGTSTGHAGSDVEVVGSWAYIATSWYGSGVKIVDISNPSALPSATTYAFTTYSAAASIEVSGGFAYVADASGIVEILNVTTPSAPTRVGQYFGSGSFRDVALSGTRLYVAADTGGLYVFDVSNTSLPLLLQPATAVGGNMAALAVQGQNIYTACGGYGLVIFSPDAPLQPAQIHGTVWNDLNGNRRKDTDEPGIAGWTVYLDSNGNGAHDPGEPETTSGGDGSYGFTNLAPGSYTVRTLGQSNWQQTVPSSGQYPVALTSGQNLTDQDFGVVQVFTTTVSKVGHVGLGASEVAVSADGNYAYVLTPESFDILQLGGPDGPVRVGSFPGIASNSGDIELAGTLAYVTDPTRGLLVLDVSDPQAPKRAGFYGMTHATEVEVLGDRAYVAGSNNLTVLDVSSPSSIQLLGTYSSLTLAYGLEVVGQTAYVADYTSGLRILDVSNPAAIQLLGIYDTPGMAECVQVVGNVAYVADYEYTAGGLLAIDVSTPATPTLLNPTTPAVNYASEVVVAGGKAYLAHGTYVKIFDVSDPANPAELNDCQVWNWSQGLAIAGDRMFVADGNALEVWDVATPASANRIASYFVPPSSAKDVDVVGTLAYVADGDQGLRILDVSDSAAPRIVGTYACYATSVRVVGSYAYVTDGWTLRVVDITSSSGPTLAGSCSVSAGSGGMDVVSSRAYLVGYNGLTIVDIANPNLPVVLGTNYDHRGNDIEVLGSLAYVANGADGTGVEVLNVSNPSALTVVGSYPVSNQAMAIEVAGGFAYVAELFGGLEVLNVSNPTTPTQVGQYSAFWYRDLALCGSKLYVACEYNGLVVLDVSTPNSPQSVEYVTAGGGNPKALAVRGPRIYTACDSYGMVVFSHAGGNPPGPLVVGGTTWDSGALTVKIGGDGLLHVCETLSTNDVVPPQPPANVTGVSITGRDGAYDELTIDFAGGDPIPHGLTWHGGSGSNGLVIKGTSGADTVNVTTAQVTVNGSIVSYTDAQSFAFDLLAGPDSLIVDGATVMTSRADAISDATDVTVTNGGQLNLGGHTEVVHGMILTGGTVLNGTLSSSALNLQSGDVTGGLTGPGGVSKDSPGILTLSGANDYSGGTSVTSGTLVLANAGALPTGTNLTVGGTAVVVFSSGFTGPITANAPAAGAASMAPAIVAAGGPAADPVPALAVLAATQDAIAFGNNPMQPVMAFAAGERAATGPALRVSTAWTIPAAAKPVTLAPPAVKSRPTGPKRPAVKSPVSTPVAAKPADALHKVGNLIFAAGKPEVRKRSTTVAKAVDQVLAAYFR